MGNAPLSPEREGPHRLSKPKTNSNARFSSKPVSPGPLTPTRSGVEVGGVVMSWMGSDAGSRQDVREALRSRIFGSAEPESPSEDEDDDLGELANNVRDRLSLSRSGSMLSRGPSARA